MKRKIEPIKTRVSKDLQTSGKLGEMLRREAKPILHGAENYLLSFHDDGVVWGKLKISDDNIELTTSGDVDANGDFKLSKTPSPKFRLETLQECRIFSTQGELFVWRGGDGNLKARLIADNSTDAEAIDKEFFDESQVLWGTQTEAANVDFTIVADGSEGLRHAFPMEKSKIEARFSANRKELKRPLRLCVRHYLYEDADGYAYVFLSRLVGVDVE